MPRPLSNTAIAVLQALAGGLRYGFDIIDATGLPSGTIYPALGKLEDAGLVIARTAYLSADSPAGRIS